MDNAEIAEVYNDIAALLDIKGESPFVVNSYRQAARMFAGLSVEVREMLRRGDDLTELPGVGKAIAGKTAQLVDEGRMDFFEKLRAEFPDGMLDIARIPGVGPKTAKRLWDELEITSLPELEAAAADGRLAALRRMGPRRAASILRSVGEAMRAKSECDERA